MMEKFSRLLAQENVRCVFDPNADTASFDLQNRVLYLPLWSGVSEDLTDMLTAHEVGHAVKSPRDMFQRAKAMGISNHIVNVVEDARIDLYMQSVYPGFKRSYRLGTKELHDRDFFELKKTHTKLSSLSLVDRINLFFKGGRYGVISVPFTAAEADVIARCENLVTFEDVLELAKELSDLDKDEQNRSAEADKTVKDGEVRELSEVERENAGEYDHVEIEVGEDDVSAEPEEEDNGEESDADVNDGKNSSKSDKKDEKDSGDDKKDSSKSDKKDEKDSDKKDSSKADDKESKKEKSSDKANGDKGKDGDEKKEDKKSDDSSAGKGQKNEDKNEDKKEQDSKESSAGAGEKSDKTPEKRPTSDTCQTMSSLEEKLTNIAGRMSAPIAVRIPKYVPHVSDFKAVLGRLKITRKYIPYSTADDSVVASTIVKCNNILRERTKDQVKTLMNRFNQKRAADAHRRTRQGFSGNLDQKRLHAFRTSDDIFLRTEIKADGQNHGLVMIVDGSSSMNGCMIETMTQTYALVEFCNRMAIPYEVYMFVSRNSSTCRSKDQSFQFTVPHTEVNIMSSRMKKSERERMWAGISLYFGSNDSDFKKLRPGVEVSCGDFYLNMTSLDASLFGATHLVDEFVKRTRVQKAHLVVLSDGEDNQGQITLRGVQGKTQREFSPYSSYGAHNTKIDLFDEMTNRPIGTVSADVLISGGKRTTFMVNLLKARMPNVNVIGFYLIGSDAHNCHHPKQFYDDRYYETKRFDMDRYFMINVAPFKTVDHLQAVGKLNANAAGRALTEELGQRKKRSVFLNTFIDMIV